MIFFFSKHSKIKKIRISDLLMHFGDFRPILDFFPTKRCFRRKKTRNRSYFCFKRVSMCWIVPPKCQEYSQSAQRVHSRYQELPRFSDFRDFATFRLTVNVQITVTVQIINICSNPSIFSFFFGKGGSRKKYFESNPKKILTSFFYIDHTMHINHKISWIRALGAEIIDFVNDGIF